MRWGVPYDVAFQMDENMRAAHAIVFSELDGADFDWNVMAFKDRK